MDILDSRRRAVPGANMALLMLEKHLYRRPHAYLA
jgi:hypothetical protein